MHCPACHQLLHEHSAACSYCGFDLAAAGRAFGEPPELEFPLSDLTGRLSLLAKRALREELLRMSRRFPQLSFAVVLASLNARTPLPAHAFWLFNTGGMTAPQEAGGMCRLVLLELDVPNARAACMIGYGLEPFVPQETLDSIADAALPDLEAGDPAAAVLAAMETARTAFATVSQTIPRAFGLSDAGQTAAAGSEEAAYAY
jgi:uncharacterized membrane protein YgcG